MVFGAFDGTDGTKGTVDWRSKAVIPENSTVKRTSAPWQIGKRSMKKSKRSMTSGKVLGGRTASQMPCRPYMNHEIHQIH